MAIPTMSDPWFDAKGKMTEEEPATPEEVQALKEFLSANITAPTAAKRIMTMTEDQIPLDDKVIRVSCLIFDAVIHFQAQQPSLIELIDAVHELSDQDLDLTVSQKVRYPRLATWKNFDQFELLSDDMRRSKEPHLHHQKNRVDISYLAYRAYRCLPDEEDVDPRDCYRRWASVNAFLAHRFVHVKDMKLPAYCMSIICDALEQEPWKHPPSRPLKESEKWKFDIKILDVRCSSTPAVPFVLSRYNLNAPLRGISMLTPNSGYGVYRPRCPRPPSGF